MRANREGDWVRALADEWHSPLVSFRRVTGVRNTGTRPARCSFLSRGGLVPAELRDSAS